MAKAEKRARPDAATSRRAGQEKQRTSSNSYYKHITQALGGQWGIADLLLPGRENAIPRRERREGWPILADNAIPATEYERAACVRHRADETAEAIDRAGV
ncbi:MAG: hypothetical protein ACLS63_06760 [Flavonifractor plautii]